MKEILLISVTAALFLSIGILAFFWPHRIREFALHYYETHKKLARFNPFLRFMRTPSYIASIRISGLLALVGSALLAFLVLKHFFSGF